MSNNRNTLPHTIGIETLDPHTRIKGQQLDIVIEKSDVIDLGIGQDGKRRVRLVQDYYLEVRR